MRVRLFNKRPNGVYYRAVWDRASGRKSVATLLTRDRDEAERHGRELLAELLRGQPVIASGPVELAALWREFSTRCTEFLDNHDRTRRDAEHRVRVLRAFFGDDLDVRTLTADDQRRYAQARRRGGIPIDEALSRPVRSRSAEADLVVLHQMLKWATTVALPDGRRWLDRNPLAGVRREREKNPRRAVATFDRFDRTRAAMIDFSESAASEQERERWMKMELALVLAEATGRRLGSIRALRWEDIDFDQQRIRWRAEADKKGREWVIPVPSDLVEELARFRVRLRATGGLLFRSESKPDVAMDRHLFDKWLAVAERKAGLQKLEGALWHAYRRKWASERKHLSIVDVAAAGGWKDTATLLECYMQPDAATLLAVMSEPRKLRAAV